MALKLAHQPEARKASAVKSYSLPADYDPWARDELKGRRDSRDRLIEIYGEAKFNALYRGSSKRKY